MADWKAAMRSLLMSNILSLPMEIIFFASNKWQKQEPFFITDFYTCKCTPLWYIWAVIYFYTRLQPFQSSRKKKESHSQQKRVSFSHPPNGRLIELFPIVARANWETTPSTKTRNKRDFFPLSLCVGISLCGRDSILPSSELSARPKEWTSRPCRWNSLIVLYRRLLLLLPLLCSHLGWREKKNV